MRMRGMKLNISVGCASLVLVLLMVLSSCQKTPPQPVRILGEAEETVDSTMVALVEFNKQMTTAADAQCAEYAKKEGLQYVLAKEGFWFCKTRTTEREFLTKGQVVNIRLQVYELNGQLIADVSETFEIGSASKPLPLAMDKALKMLRQGEQIQIIAPWYTAYGVEGIDEIKGYTNLKIVIGVES
jgi:hypothetical protein